MNEPSSVKRREPLGVIWGLLLLCTLSGAVLLAVRLWPRPEPERSGWEEPLGDASLELRWGTSILGNHVSVRPLHGDQRRQAFDAQALGRVLGREGEPFLLEVHDLDPTCLTVESLVGDDWQVLAPVEDGTHPVQRLLARTARTGEIVLFGQGPLVEPRVVAPDGVHPLQRTLHTLIGVADAPLLELPTSEEEPR